MSRPSPRSFTPLAALAVLLFSPAARADAPKEAAADPLPRRGFFGAQVAPVPPEVREREKLGQGEGVLVLAVVPGSTAEKLGLKAGDVVTAVGDAKVSTPQGLVSLVAAKTAGDPFAFTYVRGGKAETKSDALQARPRETGTDDYDVVYGSYDSRKVYALRLT